MRPNAIIIVTLTLAVGACHGGADNPHGKKQQPVMTEAALAMPIAPGKTETWRALLEDLTGPRYDEYVTSRQRFGLTAQTTFLQKTPMGDLALIHMTGADVHDAFHRMSSSQDEWDVKWRQETLDVHGVDFAKGDEVLPHIEAAWSMGDASSRAPELLFAAPLGAGGVDALRALTKELMGARHDEYSRARRAIGVEREAVFLETTKMGDVAVFYWRAADPQASLRALADSNDPFDAWLRDQAAAAHPVSLAMLVDIASQNVMVGQYPHEPH
jgi:hypothetical protein